LDVHGPPAVVVGLPDVANTRTGDTRFESSPRQKMMWGWRGPCIAADDIMIPERTRASDSPQYRDRVDAIARLASARRRTVSLVERVSAAATEWTGHTTAFAWALALVVGWTVSGPLFRYSDTWQLVINTVTNVVTFLMVFLIQRAQNKDTLALQLKVNELIAAQKGAHNSLIAIERLSEEELRTLQDRFLRLAAIPHGGIPTSVAAVVAVAPALDETDVPLPALVVNRSGA
jgi:low affinity Fe/Cu permease